MSGAFFNPEIFDYPYMQPVKEKDPIRIFANPTLERLAHTPPAVPLVTWLIVSGGALYIGWRQGPGMHLLYGFLAGLLIWTLTEYLMHRFIFHIQSERRWVLGMRFMFHGVHHAQPMVKTRLFMPLTAGIPIALIFLLIFQLTAGTLLGAGQWVAPLFAGFIMGYELYSTVHYSTHRFPNLRLLKGQRRYHMRHHGQDYTIRFGVSSPLWDFVFGTWPRKKAS